MILFGCDFTKLSKISHGVIVFTMYTVELGECFGDGNHISVNLK